MAGLVGWILIICLIVWLVNQRGNAGRRRRGRMYDDTNWWSYRPGDSWTYHGGRWWLWRDGRWWPGGIGQTASASYRRSYGANSGDGWVYSDFGFSHGSHGSHDSHGGHHSGHDIGHDSGHDGGHADDGSSDSSGDGCGGGGCGGGGD